MTTPLLRLALGLALVLSVASCGDDAGTDVELVDAETEILAIDNSFDPEDATVEAGTTVTFRNAGRNDHNVISENEDAEWAVPTDEFAPGDTASYRFTEPGEYRYYCSIHGTIDVGMPGTITVTTPGG